MKRFESYKNWINEKFVADSDPIRDMGIGIYTYRDFNTQQEFCEFMIIVIPAILKFKFMPKDILNDWDIINEKYFKQLNYYIEKYISFKGVSTTNHRCGIFAWNSIFGRYLIQKGY